MQIYLFYIDGISETDTLCPVFRGEVDWHSFDDFIHTCLVTTVDSAYYPPYYRNTITFSVPDDITFSTEVNYLALQSTEYNGKLYYYFIRAVNYVSENVISLSIEMDVIMTYMRNITLSNVIIERKFIDRWNDTINSTINRNYIRENVSNGDFKLCSCNELLNKDAYKIGWYVIKASNVLGSEVFRSDSIGTTLYCNTSAGKIKSPYYFYFIPSNNGNFKNISARYYEVSHPDDNRYVRDYKMFPFFELDVSRSLSNSAIVSCTYIPYDIFHCTPSDDGTTLKFPKFLIYYTDGYFMYYNNDTGSLVMPYEFSYKQYEDTSSIMISPTYSNHDLNEPFVKAYVPCLIDENYYRISFGDGGHECSYPLYYLKTNGMTLLFLCDLMSGIRTYHIQDAISSSNFFEYGAFNNSVLNNINVLTPELMTDTYNTWQAQNRATLLAGIAGSTINGAFNFANQAISNYTRISNIKALRDYNYQTDLQNIKYDEAAFQSTRHTDSVSQRFDISQSASMYNAQRRRDAPISKASYDFSNPLGFLISYGAESLNNYYANDIPKVAESIIPDINAKNYRPYYKIYQVSDIDYCAWYYHMNGYLVMERHDNCHLYDLMKYVSTRYYFNVLKLADCDVHLKGCIETTELVNLIKARLIKGMRLWSTENGNEDAGINLDNLKYDNVELKYIK